MQIYGVSSTGALVPIAANSDGSLSATPSVVGKSVKSAVTFSRPADVTAYAANDVISNSTTTPTLLEFTGCARAVGGQGYIVKSRIMTDQKTNVARLRLTLYAAAPTAINDNAVKSSLWANRDKLIGRIDFDALTTEDATASTCAFGMTTVILPFICASEDTKIYGILSTLDAFTPASGQQFYIELTCEQS